MKTPIYYLHIPRTSGVFIRDKVLLHSEKNQKSFLSTHKINIKLEDFKNKDYISGHYGLTPIPYVSSTFTILRDPVERTFSYMKYIWEHLYNYTSMDEAFMFFLTNKKFKQILSNQQSSFLTSEIDIDEYNRNTNNILNHVRSNWYLITKNIDKDSVIESVSKNNIQVLFFEDPELYKKVFDFYKIDNADYINSNKKINESKKVDTEFYKKYYDQVFEMNKIDIEVYNFFKGDISNDTK
jgi:hypothetical protein